jgi:hypothetical protein
MTSITSIPSILDDYEPLTPSPVDDAIETLNRLIEMAERAAPKTTLITGPGGFGGIPYSHSTLAVPPAMGIARSPFGTTTLS